MIDAMFETPSSDTKKLEITAEYAQRKLIEANFETHLNDQ